MTGQNTYVHTSIGSGTDKPRLTPLHTYPHQPIRCWADGKGQRQTGSRLGHVVSSAAPDRLDRHPVSGGVQQVDHAGFRIMPQRDRQRVARTDLAQKFRVPMRQFHRASHCSIVVISYDQIDWFRPGGAGNNT